MKIHPQALVETDQIGIGTNVWAFAHIMKGAKIGSNVNIGDHAFVESGAYVGNNVTVKNQVCIWEGITIEDDVFIGPRVTFTNDRYPRSPRMPEAIARYAERGNWLATTLVRKGCSIGAAATICPGLELGAYSVIGAGAVVTRNVPAFALMLGTPARQAGVVCSCGQPLDGEFDVALCRFCGETGAMRTCKIEVLS
jgi:UDP-2-acetamido-3-amino-2,3-dideoxy-glucuronate N-acetyltransferase